MKECPKCNLCFDDEQNLCPQDNEILFVSNKCKTILSDRYVLEKRLGKGGMGSVYKAKHKFLRSLHAIKIISPEVVRSDETLLVRFRQEAILAASIHHPNVVAVTDFGVTQEDTPFLVMEYIEGISLDDYLRRENHLSPTKAFEILSPIALGVGQAHGKGITHRDLKPLNVMLRSGYPLSQAVKVLDFGLAKIKSTESFASFIQAKTTNILGSPHYMSPEQWANEGVDTRSDIYSLGIILFQMLTGEVPFKGDSIPTIMYQHLQIPTPSFVSLGIPAEPHIEAVVQKALAKEQDERYATVEEFLSAYEEALFKSGNQIKNTSTNKTVSLLENFTSPKAEFTGESKIDTGKNFSKTYNLTYLNSAQNETLADYFNQPKQFETNENEKLEQEFIHAQNRVEAARTKVSEAEKLALEFNEAQKAAEDARHKVLQAQKKLEDDIRRRMQAEMESKLAVERIAREKAEAEASRLLEEVNSRKEAEGRANALAKTALEAQHRAEKERLKAESEAHQRQLEEGTRRKAENAALKLAEEVSEAKKKYEEAKKEAEYEAYYRMEAEIKRKKVEEEIQRISEYEAEKRKIAEAQAAYQIKEQASRLENQAFEAQKKADEARLLARSEAEKREQAETARIKAEQEARRLAEEIIEAQKRLEEAEQRAKTESEKRALEEAARKKAEASALSSSLENQQNVESLKKDLMSQIEAAEQRAKIESEKRILEESARKRAEESARSLSASQNNAESVNRNLQNSAAASESFRNSSPILTGNTPQNLDIISSGQKLTDTVSTEISNTNRIPARKNFNPVFLAIGAFIFFVFSGVGVFIIYRIFSPAVSPDGNTSVNSSGINIPVQTPLPQQLPARIKNKMVFIKGGDFLMGRNEADPKDDPIYGSQYPAHPVTVDDFYLDQTEVTNEEYAEFVKAAKYNAPDNWKNGKPPAGQERFPVTKVSNLDAGNFAAWVSSRDKTPCRLPTEQEWEYAARSGSAQNIYPWGNEWISNRVNFATGIVREVGTSSDETAVGNIKDMMGNVLEWTSSTPAYYPNFPENIKKDVSGRFTVRGVSFTKSKEEMLKKTELLLTLRQGVSPDKKFDFLGFRLTCVSK